MLLAIDIGNSNITLGGFEGETLRFQARLHTDAHRTEDQYAVELRDVLDLNGVSLPDVTDAVLCSVVPELSRTFQTVTARLFGVRPLLLGPGVKTGMRICLDDPAQLGSDLAAAAVAAIARYPLPCIVCDLGTATTVSVVDKDGSFLGVAICAGMGITLEALTTHTALLPHVSIERPASVIGRNSIAAMQSGLVLGTAAMLEGLAARIEDELGQPCTMVITGGLSREMQRCLRRDVILDEHLLLNGLRLVYERNRPRRK